MPDSPTPSPEPTPEELEEILKDLDFFLAMDEAEAVPLEAADDAEETDGD
ncbi:hypothetical protein [Deferrisoma camini]|nr:hypothetical protein [Deferrisoma camini]